MVAANRIFKMVAVICWINGFAWIMIAPHIGGSAFLGQMEGDKYFLGSHGKLTQVSRSVYMYSLIHGYTAIAGMGVFFFVVVSEVFSKENKPSSNGFTKKKEKPSAS